MTPDIGNMAPLECPEGFRPARDADHALMIAFLDAEFNRAQRGGEIRTNLPAYYCAQGVDPASKSYSAVNGCVSLAPNVSGAGVGGGDGWGSMPVRARPHAWPSHPGAALLPHTASS